MSEKSISDEEIQMFFLAAYVALDLQPTTRVTTLPESDLFFAFRHEYWKDDPRVQFTAAHEDVPKEMARGLPVYHPLAMDQFDGWLRKRHEAHREQKSLS